MGQRTQIIIQHTKLDGSRSTKVFHDQWGIGKDMFMALMNLHTKVFLTDTYEDYDITECFANGAPDCLHDITAYIAKINCTWT